jgi:hypothetical protein
VEEHIDFPTRAGLKDHYTTLTFSWFYPSIEDAPCQLGAFMATNRFLPDIGGDGEISFGFTG